MPFVFRAPVIYCKSCQQAIGDVRFKCLDCWDFFLCPTCESQDKIVAAHHGGTHVFAKLRKDQNI